VDRHFAYATHPEDQKKRLLIKRSDGEVLLDLEDAVQDVRIFRVKYAGVSFIHGKRAPRGQNKLEL